MQDAFALAEYEALLAEIRSHLDEISQVFRFSLTASVAILAWGVTQRNWLVLLTPAPLLAISTLMMLSHSESVFRIAAYIRRFIEPYHSDLMWQTRLKKAALTRGLAEQFHNSAVGISYLGISTFSLYLAWTYAGHVVPFGRSSGTWLVIFVSVISASIASIGAWRISINRTAPDKAHESVWAKVQTEEDTAETE